MSTHAQSVTPANDGTGSVVTQTGDQYTISGGSLSRDGSNLFHSFQQFGLNPSEIANFVATPTLRNLLGRVVGGDPSYINGLIQVTGGTPNLYLVNPAGIVFGASAQLNVPAAFTATTADRIGLGCGTAGVGCSGWFNATGQNSYADLVGTPNAFAFAAAQPGSIANLGTLAVGNGQSLTLLGGTVLNAGTLTAPNGQITIAAVPGSNLVRLSQPGSLLSLELSPLAAPVAPTAPIPSLPQLLTGGNLGNAIGVVVEQGVVRLTGSGLTVNSGDGAISGSINSHVALLTSAQNLTLSESQINTTGNLVIRATHQVQIRDTLANPIRAITGGSLDIQGDQGIDIFALNHPQSKLVSGGDLWLRSNGVIAGDAHYFSNGNVRIERLDGSLGNLFSPNDPIILASGDVTLGDYTGASLHILAGGQVTLGNVTITGVDTAANTINPTNATVFNGIQTLGSLASVPVSASTAVPSGTILVDGSTRPTLDVRAGIDWTQLGGFPTPDPLIVGGIAPGTGTSTSANITVGNINIRNQNNAMVLLTNRYAPNGLSGSISTQAVDTSTANATQAGGTIVVDSRGNLTTTDLRSSTTNTIRFSTAGNAGNISLTANGNLTVGAINSSSQTEIAQSTTGNGGQVALTANGNLTVGTVNSSTLSRYIVTDVGSGGGIALQANGNISAGDLNSVAAGPFGSAGNGGEIRVSANGSITAGAITSGVNSRTLLQFTAPNRVGGNGGNVSLSTLATPANGTISFTRINTTTTENTSTLGRSGDVRILANGMIRGTDALGGNTIDVRSAIANQSGIVEIQHDGGPDNIAFRVGDASITSTNGNGLIGGINALNPLASGSFDVLPTGGIAAGTPPEITVRSINSAPTLQSNPPTPTIFPADSAQFTYSDLVTALSDPNLDNLTVRIGRIDSGNLTRNGVITTADTILKPGDVLVYTPAVGSRGIFNAFTLTVTDLLNGVSVLSTSPSSQVQVNISSPPPPPSPAPPLPELPTATRSLSISEPAISEPAISEPAISEPAIAAAQTTQQTPDEPVPLSTVLAVTGSFVDAGFEAVETVVTGQFTDQLELTEKPRTIRLPEAQNTLNTVATASGVPPALIYVSFITPVEKTAACEANAQPQVSRDPITGAVAIAGASCQTADLQVMLLTPNGTLIRKRIPNTTRQQVLDTARTFRNEVADPSKIRTRSYLSTGQQLHRWLIEPLEADLKAAGIGTLVFIMDSGLRGIPLAALHNGQSFLVERYSVGLMPSLSLTDTRYVDVRTMQVLAAGASEFKDQNPLPAVPVELSAITRQWESQSLVQQAFTADNLIRKREERPFGIIHLATHGEFMPGEIANSYIQLADTRLSLNQVRQLGWADPPVELVVLSACDMAIGDDTAELGFAGFAVKAGAKSALASLWSVNDQSTAGLMARFYSALRQKPIKAEALRQAQLDMINGTIRMEGGKLIWAGGESSLPPELGQVSNQRFSHPYYWSAFTLVGSPW